MLVVSSRLLSLFEIVLDSLGETLMLNYVDFCLKSFLSYESCSC